jgi:pyruvate carboxylase subunit B
VELIARLKEERGEREEREERVRLERLDGERVRVVVGERSHEVDAVRLDLQSDGAGGVWTLIVDGAQYEVAVSRAAGGGWTVSTAGREQRVEVTDPLTHLARAAHEAAGASGVQKVVAYMPGRVVAVLVAEGDEVAAGQGVVVLEAMKMENEIAAEHAGRIGRVHVEEGQAVEGGDVLFELEAS